MSLDLLAVSIVTPSYNQGGFIAETISSVLSQDYSRIEYLVVDGGSSDGTIDVLRRYGDQVHWISEPDRGQADAINKGWRRARGEIIAWLNADDVYRPGAIGNVVAFFRDHPQVDLVYGDCEYINERGDIIGRHRVRALDFETLLTTATNSIPQPAAFVRRRVLETVGYLNEKLHYVMDFEYWLRVSAYHEIAYLPVCLAAFRYHATSKTVQQATRMGDELVELYQRLFDSRQLPERALRFERIAMSNAYYQAAEHHIAAGNMKEARRCVLAGWWHRPLRPQRTLLAAFLRRPGSEGDVLESGSGRRCRP